MSSATYGANIAFIEELHEKFLNDPESVSPSWREFFRNFDPEEEEHEQVAAVAASGGATGFSPSTPAAGGLKPAAPQTPAPQPAPAPAPRPTAVPTGQNAVPLRGAASKIVSNMETS